MDGFSDIFPLQTLIRNLQRWAPLSEADQSALRALPFTLRSVKADHYLVRDGDRPKHSCLLIQGIAYRQKIVGDGGKQIFALYLVGDLIHLQNSLGRADHNVQMLSDGEVALIPSEAIHNIAAARPAIARAMWYHTLVEYSLFREWITNNGRRDAHARIAHLLCELALRLEAAGLSSKISYELPMSQEWIADALSLTPVHVNRILGRLHKEGLIDRTKRRVVIRDWDRLAAAGDFDPAYLYLNVVPAAL